VARWETGARAEEKPFKSLFQKLEWAFLLWGTEARSLSDTFFKWPGLVGKGNKVKAFNYVPFFNRLREEENLESRITELAENLAMGRRKYLFSYA